ncbi:MAG: CHAT domain-containing protein [Crinalium sp.]
MTKLVVLHITAGNFENGFSVTLEIAEEGKRSSSRPGKLPPAPEIPTNSRSWQESYRGLSRETRLGKPAAQITNIGSYHGSAKALRDSLLNWYKAEEFRKVRERLLQQLDPPELIRLIVQPQDPQLLHLPWHIFFEEFLEHYHQAEVGLAAPEVNCVERDTSSATRSQVRILAILGNSEGINVEADQKLIEQLPGTDPTFLNQPTREVFNSYLWEQDWDILFFAGHSSSRSETGRMFINENDSLTIEDLKFALREAIARGLKLAIFNSCDGLGLAESLAELQIPQIIVMREDVPDVVAQEFLKYFLDSFSKGKSLYQSVRKARERLKILENQFPHASWLPVIFQNPTEPPLYWKEFYQSQTSDQSKVPDKLSWEELHTICKNLTQDRMATVRHKYKKNLYLQRNKTRYAFENFLGSEKRCFVLIGKSGVGKSNFLCALAEEFQTPNTMCVLMYDGARLETAETVTDLISKDFSERLTRIRKEIQDIKNIWAEIAKMDQIEKQLIILCIDAINENPKANDLLIQLDKLVQDGWHWLKVVFSCRPETWQAIKRDTKLSEAYYYQETEVKTWGIGSKSLSSCVLMEPFSRQELPQVYAKYKQEFKLKTEYKALQGELRKILADPFNLLLVATTYAGTTIPNTLKVRMLVEKYINALVEDRLLQEEDLSLLEKILVPSMALNGRYSNTIANVNSHNITNLLDADILVNQVEGGEKKIAFKYERFYEYFMAKALSKELAQKALAKQNYKEWITQLPNSPYLWGAIKNCLEQQMHILKAEECTSLCIQLVQPHNQRMDEIVIAALIEYGNDEYEKVYRIIEPLLNERRGWLRNVVRRGAIFAQCPPAKRIAIDVASSLKISKLIEFALCDFSPAVRAVAIRYAFIYWCGEPEAVFEILKHLISSKGLFKLPTLCRFESAVGLSLLILFEDFKNKTTISNLRQQNQEDDDVTIETTLILRNIWRHAIKQLLLVNPEQAGSIGEQIKGRIRALLLWLVVVFIVKLADEAPSNSALSIPELNQFFKRDRHLRKRQVLARKIVLFMDVNRTDVRDIRDDLLGLAAERDMMLAWLTGVMLTKHVLAHPKVALPVVKDVFDQAIKVEKPGPFCLLVGPTAIMTEADYGEFQGEALKLYIYMVTNYLERFKGKCWCKLQVRRFTNLDAICFAQAGQHEDIPLTSIARHYIEKMIKDKDSAWMKDFIQFELTMRAIESGYLKFAFSALEMLVKVKESSVEEAIIELLARIRVYNPDEVDDFMESYELDERFVKLVRTRVCSETLGDLLGLRSYIFWREAISLGGSPELWQKWMWLFQQFPECRRLEQWLTILFKFTVNQIYGGTVFPNIPG